MASIRETIDEQEAVGAAIAEPLEEEDADLLAELDTLVEPLAKPAEVKPVPVAAVDTLDALMNDLAHLDIHSSTSLTNPIEESKPSLIPE